MPDGLDPEVHEVRGADDLDRGEGDEVLDRDHEGTLSRPASGSDLAVQTPIGRSPSGDSMRRRPATAWSVRLDRLARSVKDARDIADELTTKGVALSLGGSRYDPTDPVGRLLFNVLAMVAEFERDLISMRTKEGMAVAKAKGRLKGKQPKLSLTQRKLLFEVQDRGEYTQAEVAELFSVSRATVYRELQKRRAALVGTWDAHIF